MAKWTLLLAGPLLAMCAGVAQANSYLGLDYTSLDVDDTLNTELNPKGLRLRLGLRFSDTFDIEIQAGSTGQDNVLMLDELNITYAGAYLKGYLPFGQRSAIYAMGGMAAMTVEEVVGNRDVSSRESDFSYGFGLETQLSRQLDLSADYMRYTGDIASFSDFSTVNIGLKWYF